MKRAYIATSIPVLRFSKAADSSGHAIPPKTKVTFDDEVKVYYDGMVELDSQVGTAVLMRKGVKILADITVYSNWSSSTVAREQMGELYPCCALTKQKTSKGKPEHYHVEYLILSPHGNLDDLIAPLGKNIFLRPKVGTLQ